MLSASTRVLIVDDMTTMRTVVWKYLKDMGIENIYQATNGFEAYSLLEGCGFDMDLVVCDWNMEPMNGFELLKKLRAHEAGKKIPFVMITTEADMTKVKTCIQVGVDGYIIKPISFESFKTKINAIALKIIKKKYDLDEKTKVNNPYGNVKVVTDTAEDN